MSSRIRASSSALQMQKVLVSAREHKLHRLHEQQGQVGQGLLPPGSDTAQRPLDGSAVSAARARHLQVLITIFPDQQAS